MSFLNLTSRLTRRNEATGDAGVSPAFGSKSQVSSALLLALAVSPLMLSNSTFAIQPATQPSIPTAAAIPSTGLEKRAMEALNARDYATALPLLRRLQDIVKGDDLKERAVAAQVKEAEAALAAGITPNTSVNETRKPHVPPTDGKPLEFPNIKDLGNFDYDGEKGGGIPADVKALTGKTIRVRGFMIPLDQSENITSFALVPSLFACCFGQPPSIQHTIIVKTPKGKSVSYYPDELLIEGALKVEEKKEDGFIVSVFDMTAASVKPAPAPPEPTPTPAK